MPAASRPGQQTKEAGQGTQAGLADRRAGPGGHPGPGRSGPVDDEPAAVSSARRDPASVLDAEREHMRRSRDYLRMMREDVLGLRAMGGDPISEEYLKAALYARAEALQDLPGTPLFFGRLDFAAGAGPLAGPQQPDRPGRGAGPAGERFHIGRRHVHDPDGRPAVIDWRAPVSRAFYRASRAEPMGLARRRRFGFAAGELSAYEDEEFGPPGSRAVPGAAPADGPQAQVSRILIDEIERPRSGPMRDIVATIQPDQDDIVRAEADQTVCVQGAPGTGKTAVGLHRVAYLLYANRERMSRGGVLVVGPNRGFLAYIRDVLPALGEVSVTQVTVAATSSPGCPCAPPMAAGPAGSRLMRGWRRCSAGRSGRSWLSPPGRSRCPAGPGAGGSLPARSPASSLNCAAGGFATGPAGTCWRTGSPT
jgi:hypothetical protein